MSAVTAGTKAKDLGQQWRASLNLCEPQILIDLGLRLDNSFENRLRQDGTVLARHYNGLAE
jgi:hypothetical protein